MAAYLAVIVTGAFFLRAFFYQNNEIESFEYELCWDEGVIIGVPVRLACVAGAWACYAGYSSPNFFIEKGDCYLVSQNQN